MKSGNVLMFEDDFRDVFPLISKLFLKAFTPPVDSEIKGNTKESQGEYFS